jgi:hypothetical protein
MRGRTGAFLTLAGGIGCLLLAAAAQEQRSQAAPLAAPAKPVVIDWVGARQQAKADAPIRDRMLGAGFMAANQAVIAKITIPVLLPGDRDLARGLRIFPSGPGYTASSATRGMGFLLTGSGRVFALGPKIMPNLPVDGVVVSRTESGLDASFNRFGAGYSISLDCKRPADSRCQDPTYLRGVVTRLAVVVPGG